jgi:hypothetical protein
MYRLLHYVLPWLLSQCTIRELPIPNTSPRAFALHEAFDDSVEGDEGRARTDRLLMGIAHAATEFAARQGLTSIDQICHAQG